MTTLDASVPFRYVPVGASDSLDATTTFPGAMSSLSNLIPDQTTRSIWVCRPAALELTNFTGFTTPGAVSVLLGVGTRVYGMIATGRNAGKDEPFSYNTVTSSFDTISGVTNANSPTTQATTGAWTPPTIALIGTKIIITHPGFSGSAGVFFGVLDIANPASPTWASANTATNPLPVVPTAVAQFSGRAWFAVNPPTGQPATYASDILDPLTVTNTSQVLFYGDNRALTALGSLGITNHISGSVVQSLIVFKGSVGIFQVTGDFATGDIALNALPIATGTDAPRSICSTPKGLGFVSPDGFRIMGNDSVISDPVGMDGTGITVPFSYASVPSRMVATCNGDTVRISVQNGYLPTAPNQEWWFHLARGVWSGPHTFPMSQITALGTYFIGAPVGVTGKLFRSEAKQLSSSTYTENGTPLQWRWETAYLPDSGAMAETSIIETTINLAYPNTAGSINITAQDETESVINSVSIATSGDAPIWGTMVWGAFTWGGTVNTYQSRVIPWTKPIVFRRLKLSVNGVSGAATRIGDAYLRYNPLMYLQQN